MRSPEAVWITGCGAGTPLGWDFATVADNLLAGKSGVVKVESFDVSQHPSQIAATIGSVPCPPGWDAANFAARARLEQLALWCCVQALGDAGLWQERASRRIGLVFSNSTEWGCHWEDDANGRGREPVCDPCGDPPSVAASLKAELGLTGPAITLSSACASGNYALALARRWLEFGWADAVVAGGCDVAVTPMILAGFGNLRALSRQNDRPAAASRPFDRARDGFVLAEGGTVFVMERATSARRRNVRVYGEMAGCGLSSDAYHPVIPSPEPKQAIVAVRAALKDAKLDPADVDYVNAHGTSTPVGDVAEARALREVFGERVKSVPVSSTKSMTGHLLTAAAALEALACLTTFARSAIPPTINLDDPDPECDLCHVANQSRPQPVRIAISNSFGFGGSNSCAVFRAV